MRPQTVAFETTYWPSSLGPYLWLEFDASRVAADVDALRRAGFTTLRVHLAWDAFMPTHRQVSRPRLRDFETLLGIAGEAGMGIVPVLFVQTIGDVVMLPRFAVDRERRSRGVRVVCDGIVESGSPRDLYADPLAVEAAVLWIDTMLGAFANHPAIAAWDMGHDPATSVRPRRTAEFSGWVAEMAGRVRAQGDRCRLTLGAGDILTARAVRPSSLAAHVDRLGFAVMPQRLRFGTGWPDPGDMAFLCQLAQRLCGAVDIGFDLCVAAAAEGAPPARPRDPGIAADEVAARYAQAVAPSLADAGAVAIGVWPSHRVGARAAESPPFDSFMGLASAGLFDTRGDPTVWGEAVSERAKTEFAVSTAAPWPAELDESDYYANLPDATKELFTSWRSGGGDAPAIVV